MNGQPVFLFYNHGGSDNRGCEAIVRSTSALLRERFPGARIELCSHAPEQDAALACVDALHRHGVKPLSYDRLVNSFASRLGAPRAWQLARNNMPFLRRAKRADLCFSIGGDTYCYKRPEMLYAVNSRLARMGKKTVLWGCSVEPSLLEGELLEDLRTYSLIVARESISEKAMLEKGLPVVRFPDPAFTMRMEDAPGIAGFVPGRTKGLNVSPLILKNAANGHGAQEAFIALARRMISEDDATLLLIPHVTWAHDDDREALSAIKAALGDDPRVLMLPEGLCAPQIKQVISQLSLLVTARTHASVAAYSTAVPTLVIGYSVKARGIARDLYGDESGHVLPVQELQSTPQLIEAYDAFAAGAQAERAFLRERLPVYMQGADEVMNRLEALMP